MKVNYSDSFIEALQAGANALRDSAHQCAHEMEKETLDISVAEILVSQIEASHQKADLLQGFINRNKKKETDSCRTK